MNEFFPEWQADKSRTTGKIKWWMAKAFGKRWVASEEDVMCVGYFYRDELYIEKLEFQDTTKEALEG